MTKILTKILVTFTDRNEDTLTELARLAFGFANRAGFDGRRVSNLTFKFADTKNDPLNQKCYLGYDVEVSDEEYSIHMNNLL